MAQNPTSQRILGKDATDGITAALDIHMPGASLLLACDDQTWIAAGEKVAHRLSATRRVKLHSFGKHVTPSVSHAQQLAEMAQPYDGLIAVGSGTVSDIVKHAAYLAGKPYSVVATAASMNGYTSRNASLEENGHKQSKPGVVPKLVIADLAILAAAPKRLTRAGLGDTLCRSTVEADVMLSHYLLGTPYPRDLFDILRGHEAELIGSAAAMREGDLDFTGKLMFALLDAGDAMTIHGSSAVASQGEHMIAHTLELMYGSELHQVLHGELIGIATLTVNHLQHKMLLGTPSVKALPREAVQFERLFGKKGAPGVMAQYETKVIPLEKAKEINARLETEWPMIKNQLAEIMVPVNAVERAFIHSGVATKPGDIGLEDERYRFACTYAYLTRERFTFLDLATMNDKRIAA